MPCNYILASAPISSPLSAFFAAQETLDRDDGLGVKEPRFLASFFSPSALRSMLEMASNIVFGSDGRMILLKVL